MDEHTAEPEVADQPPGAEIRPVEELPGPPGWWARLAGRWTGEDDEDEDEDGDGDGDGDGGDDGEAGMSTAEYAVGTVAACAFAAVLYRVVTGGSVVSALGDLVDRALATLS
jgi:hypothetical protein